MANPKRILPMKQLSYDEFKQLAEHPQHRDVAAIFKLEVLETEELEDGKRSHYPKYKVSNFVRKPSPQPLRRLRG